jgi:5-methylcytosine-specific restriction endonuclease McrA
MVTRSPAGGFVYLTPDAAMANLQALQRREAVKQWRQSIKDAFGCKCAYCGVESDKLTLDHVHPKTKGGEDLATNIVPACVHCNHSKGSSNWKLWFRNHAAYSEERERVIDQWTSLLCPT